MAIEGNYRIALVKMLYGYSTSKTYGFALFDDLGEINTGDLVLVDANNQMQLASVEGITSREIYEQRCPSGVTKEVVCLVDARAYYRRKDIRKRLDKLKLEMNKLVQKNQQFALYQMMAETDPAMKNLFDEYRALMSEEQKGFSG